jgi:hypothetical protein
MDPKHPLPEDSDTDAALRAGLRSDSLSADALERIRAAVASEWQATLPAAMPAASRPAWRWLVAAGLAAIVLSISWMAALDLRSPDAAATLATLVRTEAPGVRWQRLVLADRPLADGAAVLVGQTLTFDGASLLALGNGASLRIKAGSSIRVSGANELQLERGEIYADLPPGTGHSLTITTADGEFRHVGTQYSLAKQMTGTRLRVREGRVQWSAGAVQQVGEAGFQFAIRGGRIQSQEALASAGADWQWVENLAPEFVIEERSLLDFLNWVARETGHPLQFADSEARSHVAGIVLHGNVRGLDPRRALARVMATTALSYEWSADAIRVSLPREEPSPPR